MKIIMNYKMYWYLFLMMFTVNHESKAFQLCRLEISTYDIKYGVTYPFCEQCACYTNHYI